MAERDFERLKQKYQPVLALAGTLGARLVNVHMEGGKLLIRAEAPSEEAKNRLWDEIKRIDPGYGDLTADITVPIPVATAGRQATVSASVAGGGTRLTYTVQPGDTLSKIARQFYGDASQYNRIFEANREVLTDPDRIGVGQKLVIPE